MSKIDAYSVCNRILSKNRLANYKIDYILVKNENNTTKYQAYTTRKSDPDRMLRIEFNNEDSYKLRRVPDWDYNVDGYFLEDLENGFKIAYMPLETHYDFWCAIDEWRDEIDHQDGLQNYLSYCHMNDISKHEIGLLQLGEVDIMDLYQEKNAGYTIIAEMKCGEKAIVLGKRKNNPERFVTWQTYVDRRRGFDVGHYFSDFTHAYQDFEKRSHSMMDNELNTMKHKCHPKKIEQER